MPPPKLRRAFNFHFRKVDGGLPCIHTVIPVIKRALRNSQAWIHTTCVLAAGITGYWLFEILWQSEGSQVLLSSWRSCHDLWGTGHSLVGCIVSGVVYKFDSFMGEMGMEGNILLGILL